MSKYSLKGRPLELRPFSGQTLTDVLGYLRRDVPRVFADLFAILARDDRFESGQYRPSLTLGTNVDAADKPNGPISYYRVFDMVTVFGSITIDPTATGDFDMLMSLPIPSSFVAKGDCGGSAGAQNGSTCIYVWADVDSGAAQFVGNIGTASNSNLGFQFSYRIK
jgi:hypothetical protein